MGRDDRDRRGYLSPEYWNTSTPARGDFNYGTSKNHQAAEPEKEDSGE